MIPPHLVAKALYHITMSIVYSVIEPPVCFWGSTRQQVVIGVDVCLVSHVMKEMGSMTGWM